MSRAEIYAAIAAICALSAGASCEFGLYAMTLVFVVMAFLLIIAAVECSP